MRKGILITFEGVEGSGKTTQIGHAAKHLRRMGWRVLVLREPGGTETGEAIRALLLNPKLKKISAKTELLLYLAARAQIVEERILPALRAGEAVLLDRFEDSTVAYQGFGRRIDLEEIEVLSRFVRGRLKPDLTILLDLDPRRGLTRGGRHDRMEKQSIRFHNRVRRGFLKLAEREPRRFCVLRAADSLESVTRQMIERLDDLVQ
jgi:dTMP kinase